MKKLVLLAIAALFIGLARLNVQAEPNKDAPAGKVVLPVCPVMGEAVNFYVMTDTKDGPVYFCCKMCVGDYQKDPAKYAAKVETQRKILHHLPSVQVACPISGKPVNDKYTVDDHGHKIAFCCGKCPAVYEKDPAKYHAKLMGMYTYQTICPVGGEKIDPSAFTMVGDQRVYFCCAKCIAKFEADPAKYADKLAEQGYKLKLPKKP